MNKRTDSSASDKGIGNNVPICQDSEVFQYLIKVPLKPRFSTLTTSVYSFLSLHICVDNSVNSVTALSADSLYAFSALPSVAKSTVCILPATLNSDGELKSGDGFYVSVTPTPESSSFAYAYHAIASSPFSSGGSGGVGNDCTSSSSTFKMTAACRWLAFLAQSVNGSVINNNNPPFSTTQPSSKMTSNAYSNGNGDVVLSLLFIVNMMMMMMIV